MALSVSDLASYLGDWSVGNGPLHRKLANALRHTLEDGTVVHGDRLPAEREMARALAVSRTTVVAAYDRLEASGWVERRQGSGTRVSGRAGAGLAGSRNGFADGGTGAMIFQRLIEGDGELISLASATHSGAPAVTDAIAAAAADGADRLVAKTGYVPRGLPVLRRELARVVTRTGIPTGDEQLLVTTGAHQALALTAALYIRPGDTVIVESPSFPGCLDVFRAAGARLLAVPIDDEGLRPDLLEAALDATPASLIYVMPTYHNPAGVVLADYRRRRLAEAAAAAGVPILEDNALEGASLGHPTPPPVGAYAEPNGAAPVLTVGSLSKSLWAGLRVGWVRAPAPVIDRLTRLKTMADLGSPLFDQAVAARLVPDLESHVAARSVALQAGLAQLEAALAGRLPSWRWNRPAGGPSLWVQIPQGDTATFAQVALRHGVEVVPGETMAPDGGHRDRLRIPFCFEPPVIDEMVTRLAAAWDTYTNSTAAWRQESPAVVV